MQSRHFVSCIRIADFAGWNGALSSNGRGESAGLSNFSFLRFPALLELACFDLKQSKGILQ
jgi:hypothetical protein